MLVAALAAIGAVHGAMARVQDHQADQFRDRIAELMLEREAGQERPSVPPVDAHLAELTRRAGVRADAVAVGQQEYAVLFRAAAQASGPGNGAPSAELLRTAEHRRVLAELWDPSSFVLDEDLAYQWTTAPSFERDQIDPRFHWYIRHDGVHPSDPATYTWRAESVMPVMDGSLSARVVWFCEQADGTLLAWASATYNDRTGLFSGLSLSITAEGVAHLSLPERARADRVPDLKDMTTIPEPPKKKDTKTKKDTETKKDTKDSKKKTPTKKSEKKK